jgi:hypothetical protein
MSNETTTDQQPSPIGGSNSFRIKSMKKNKIQKTRGHDDSSKLSNSDAADCNDNGSKIPNANEEWLKKMEGDAVSIIQPKYAIFLSSP